MLQSRSTTTAPPSLLHNHHHRPPHLGQSTSAFVSSSPAVSQRSTSMSTTILRPLFQSMSHGFSSLSGMRDCLYNLRIQLYGMGQNNWDQAGTSSQVESSRNNRGILQGLSAPRNRSDIQANHDDVLGFSMRDYIYNLRTQLYEVRRNNWDEAGTSSHVEESWNNQVILQGQSAPPNMSDVQANEDDVLECSPRDFAEAQANSRRTRRRPLAEVDLEPTAVTDNKRRRVSPNQTITNSISMKDTATQSSPPPPPPKELTFSCPICMAPFVEEMSTKCGHIFCKECMKTAIRAKPKCPTCRTKVSMRGLIRVFLPMTC